MAIHTRLQKRKENGVYYCRVSVPIKLRAVIGKSEIHVSLKTTSALIARESVRLESLRIDRMLAEAGGKSDQINGLGAFLSPVACSPTAQPSISFMGLVERFVALPERAKLTDKGKLEYRVTFRLLAELFGGSTPINTITRVDCRRAQSVFMRLPANSTKRFPNSRVLDIIARAEKQKIPPMAPKTANSYLIRLSTLFKWAEQEGLISSNPAKGLLLPESEAQKDKRQPFTMAQLNSIFGDAIMRDNRERNADEYWIPMLALWTGARLNELCQLLINDIQVHDGIACISIAGGDGKRLKTASSKRIIPIHPQLISLGFLTYVERVKVSGAKNLFPALAMRSASDGFSKRFARYLAKTRCKTDKNCFHSFRHNFRDALREAGIEREVVQALGGWREPMSNVATETFTSADLLEVRLTNGTKVSVNTRSLENPLIELLFFQQQGAEAAQLHATLLALKHQS